MKTVLEPLDAALAALNAEIRRLTIARDDLASLIEQVRDAPPVTASPTPSPASGKGRPRAVAGPRRLEPVRTARPLAKRLPPVERPCPVPGCDRMCGSGTGLAAHLRSAHPDFVVGAQPATSLADAEQGLTAL